MPSYDDQLSAYRAQLATIASNQAQAATIVPGSGAMSTAGLAFNSMMSDVARAAAFVHTVPSTPGFYGLPIAGQAPYNMGLGEAAWAVTGMGMPSSPMYLDDYRYLATARLSRFSDSAAVGLLSGTGGLVAGMATGALVGTSIGGPVGTLVGALAGGVTSYAVSKGLAGQAGNISNLTDTIRSVTPMVFGGQGTNLGVSRDMARMVNRWAISESQSFLGSPSDQLDIANLALTGGTKYGLFNGTTDVDSFKHEFQELTRVIRDVSNTLRMSREEIVPLIAEMRQGGFYGAASAQSGIVAGSGMAYGAGLNFGSMHEAGLRGAAMFRGTGVPTQFGYQTAQANLFQVSRMQQLGMVPQEAINQLGGRTGAAEALTQGTATFIQGPLGRATAAILMQGAGGVNQGALNTMLSGDPMAALNLATVNPADTLNPMNVGRLWGQLGPEGAQNVQAAWMNHYAKVYAERFNTTYENGFGLMSQQLFPQMGIEVNAGNQALWLSRSQNLVRLNNEQRSSVMGEARRSADDAYNRRYSFWEDTGINPAGRATRRFFTPAWEGVARVGEGAGDVVRDISDWVAGRERNIMGNSEISRALIDNPMLIAGASRAHSGVLSRADAENMEAMGLLRSKGDWTYKPTATEHYLNPRGWVRNYAATDADKVLYDAQLGAARDSFSVEIAAKDRARLANIFAGDEYDAKLANSLLGHTTGSGGEFIKASQAAVSRARGLGVGLSESQIIRVWGEKALGSEAYGAAKNILADAGSSAPEFGTAQAKKNINGAIFGLMQGGVRSNSWLTVVNGELFDADRAAMVKTAGELQRYLNGDPEMSEAEYLKAFRMAGGGSNGLAGLSKLRGKGTAQMDAAFLVLAAGQLAAGELQESSLQPWAKSVIGGLDKKSAAYAPMSAIAGGKGAMDVFLGLSDKQINAMAGEKGQAGAIGGALKRANTAAQILSEHNSMSAEDIKFREKMFASDLGFSADEAARQAQRQYDLEGYKQLAVGHYALSQSASEAGSRDANKSARLGEQALAYRLGGGDMQMESMKQIYTALVALNKKIDEK
ncbi:MAG: hypothetical protein ABFE07_29485 [Armatimonadia bacterium]